MGVYRRGRRHRLDSKLTVTDEFDRVPVPPDIDFDTVSAVDSDTSVCSELSREYDFASTGTSAANVFVSYS